MVDPSQPSSTPESRGGANRRSGRRFETLAIESLGLGCAGVGMLLFALLALIPLALLVGGGILLFNSFTVESAARAYRAAPPCVSAPAVRDCYKVESGTIAAASIRRGRGGDTTTLDINLPEGRKSTWVSTSWAAEDALTVGSVVSVKLYHDQITVVALPGFLLVARDNPARVQKDFRLAGLLLIGMGALLAVMLGVSVWRSRGKRPPGYIDPNLPPAEQEKELRRQLGLASTPWADPAVPAVPAPVPVMLPLTLRPQPISTGRPWWLAALVVMFGFPSIALRMRAPQSVLVGTIIVSAALALAVVAFHLLYTHNRRLVVDDINITLFDLWGRQRVVARSEIQRIALRTIISFSARVPDERRMLLVGADGSCLLPVPKYNLSYDDASQLAAVLRIPIDSPRERRVLRGALKREIPGSLTWYERHMMSVTIVSLVAILGATFLFIWAASGFR
jgi:hypothetical protein